MDDRIFDDESERTSSDVRKRTGAPSTVWLSASNSSRMWTVEDDDRNGIRRVTTSLGLLAPNQSRLPEEERWRDYIGEAEHMRTTNRDDFEYWLADMDDALERFLALLPAALCGQLDYSIGSLDPLEQWILERYASTKAMLEPTEAGVVDGLARYIGETLRKNVGGHWDIRLDDPKYVFYGLPELTGFGARSAPESPLTLATAAADRRTGHYIRKNAEAMHRRYRP